MAKKEASAIIVIKASSGIQNQNSGQGSSLGVQTDLGE